MSNSKEIKVYTNREELEADYEQYVKDWKYDAQAQSGIHKSGLRVNKVYLDGLKFEYENLPEWEESLAKDGFSSKEMKQYLTMINNQFYIINEKNPPREKVLTKEEEIAELEKDRNEHIARLKKYGKFNHRTDEEIDQSIKEFNEFFDDYYYTKRGLGR